MKQLYLTVLELLKVLEEIKYIDLDVGQILEEKPPLAYPAALIDVSLPRIEDLGGGDQHADATVAVRLVFKALGETNNLTTEVERLKAVAYFDLVEKVYHLLNAYQNDMYYPFSCTAIKTENLRRGLKVVRLTFSTSWRDYTASLEKDMP